MCGFAAIVSLDGSPIDVGRLRRMTHALRHRGPDDEGYLLASHRTAEVAVARGRDTMAGLDLPSLEEIAAPGWTMGVGVRRLAIRAPGIDGHQPMGDRDRALWVAFNGELYGDREVRERLSTAGWRFASDCDTETLLAAWSAWGADALERLNGMWACAVWDSRRRQLTCARDRFGIKPLYYGRRGESVFVASEIKALLAALDERPAPHWPAIVDYVASRVTDHTDATFFDGIRQLPYGCLLAIDARGVTLRRWYDDAKETVEAPAPPTSASGDEGAAFHRALEDSVDDHLEGEARVGASLSGGLDSSSIVMAASRPDSPRAGDGPLDVFTAVFDDPAVDERDYARAVAEAAGVRQHLAPIDPKELIDDLPRVLWHQDEPILSTSVLAQWQVMKRAAAEGVRVVLDGQGADELLGGYPALMGPHLADLCRAGEWRQLAREARLGADAGLGGAGHLLARAALEQLPGTWRSVVARLAQRQVHGLHADLVGYWRPLAIPAPRRAGRASHMTAALSTLVRTTSLPALLRYLDRNGMAWSLEPRVPFLDTRVAAASRALSSAARFSRGLGKSVLRDARWSRLPRLVAERRQKNGFLTPESAWWRGALRSWAIDVLDPGSVARNGVLDAAAVARVRDDLRSPEGPPPPAGLWRWINIELWMQARDAGLASEAG